MILRNLAMAWVRESCPRNDVRDNFVQQLDSALQQGVGCSFLFGRNLTKAGKPYLLYGFCGEFFAFELTPEQAAQLNVRDNVLVAARGLTQQHHGPHPEPLVQLGKVDVDYASAIDRSSPVAGTLTYRTSHDWLVPLAVQVACEPAGHASIVLYHHLFSLRSPEGTIRFSLSPLGDLRNQKDNPYCGVLPLFFQICLTGDPDKPLGADPLSAATLAARDQPHVMQPPPSEPWKPAAIGVPFEPPSPLPSSVTPTTWQLPPTQHHPTAPTAHFRAVSDILAVLVEVV